MQGSVVDPDTLNFDPGPEFWPNLDPDSDPNGYVINFEKNNKNNLFLTKKRTKSDESLNGEFISEILHLLPLFHLIFTCLDPDPYWEYGSGSTKLLKTHNTGVRC